MSTQLVPRVGEPRHLVVMAAGTGGHVMPGLAVAREVLARGWTVSWLGTRTGMENRLVPPAGIPLDTINFSGVRGKGLFGTFKGLLQLVSAFGACRHILATRKASAVLGMGGYVCVPGGKMDLAMQLILTPLILKLMDTRRRHIGATRK